MLRGKTSHPLTKGLSILGFGWQEMKKLGGGWRYGQNA